MSRNARIGAFIILALLVFGYLTYKAGTFGGWQRTYKLRVEFDTVGGLTRGAPVRISGVNVGTVDSLSLEQNSSGPPKAVVLCSIVWDTDISEDAVGTVQIIGFLGDSVLDISTTPGKPVEKDRYEAVASIRGNPPFQMQKLVAEVQKGVASLAPLVESASAIIGSATTRQSIQAILVSLRRVTESVAIDDKDQLNRILDKTESALSNFQIAASSTVGIATSLQSILADNREDLTYTLKDIRATLQNIRQHEEAIAPNLIAASSRTVVALESFHRAVDRLDAILVRNERAFDSIVANASGTMNSTQAAARDLQVILEGIKQGKGTVGKLVTDETFATDVTHSVRDVRKMMERYGSPLANTHLVYEMRGYGEDEWDWSDHDSHMSHDLYIEMPFGQQYFLRAGANDIGADTGLDLEFGYRWKRLAARLGVIDSEAALGADIDLWPGHLTATGEYIGITDEDEERFNSFLSVDLPYDFDLLIGVDDVFDEQLFNAGVRKTF